MAAGRGEPGLGGSPVNGNFRLIIFRTGTDENFAKLYQNIQVFRRLDNFFVVIEY
jgi:hypothetical protein